MHPIPKLILSALSTSETIDEARKACAVADRAISSGDDGESCDHMEGLCDAVNAADLTVRGMLARLDGDIAYALRCERARDSILDGAGL